MSGIDHPEQDPKFQLDQIIEPYFAEHHRQKCYVGLLFQQGMRKMVQINVPAHDLPILLQSKPSTDNDPDSGKNRPEIKGHANDVKNYILKRIKRNKPWILGTLTANIDPNKITIVELSRGLCFVMIPRGVKLDITDGQHRKRAIHELIESSEGELIGDNDFPITLVLEKDFTQCQTDFRDMAQTKPLQKNLLNSFGEQDGKVGITKNLIQNVSMFIEKTEMIKNNPSTKNKLIYTTTYIERLVSCAFKNDVKHDLLDYDVDQLSEILANILNQFFQECIPTRYIVEKNIRDLTIEDIAKFKDDYILGMSAGLEILGCLLYCCYEPHNLRFVSNKVSQLANLDWSRSSDIWQGNIILFEPNPKNPAKPYSINNVQKTRKIAVNQAKAKLGWE
ncbi:MAG: DNA sulfur modification protein DndB [Cyanobacteria bacterium SBLK]|nr:DNA sulfur modification protein DndB [Cyanobacteria bacterium SBLK]